MRFVSRVDVECCDLRCSAMVGVKGSVMFVCRVIEYSSLRRSGDFRFFYY